MSSLRLVFAVGRPLEITPELSGAVIGRSADADFTIDDGSVSRRHARLEWRGKAWFVVDLGSANGTFVAGQRIGEAAIENGQEIRFGSVNTTAELGSSEGSATVAVAGLTAVMPAFKERGLSETAAIESPPGSPPPPPPPPAPPSAAAPAPPPPPAIASNPGPAPGGSPVGQMAPPPAPPRKGRSPVFWMVAGCGGCLTVTLLAIAGVGLSFWLALSGPSDGARAQLLQIGAGDLQGAYSELAGEYRAEWSAGEFAALVASHPGLESYSAVSFNSTSVENSRARLAGTLSASSGEQEQVALEMVEERGKWRIAAIRFDAYP